MGRGRVERGEFDGNRDKLLEHSDLDAISRERWAVAAGVVMVRTWAPALIHEIVSCGRDEFKRIYAPTARVHGFKDAEVDAIWRMIVRTAELNPIGQTHIERMPV